MHGMGSFGRGLRSIELFLVVLFQLTLSTLTAVERIGGDILSSWDWIRIEVRTRSWKSRFNDDAVTGSNRPVTWRHWNVVNDLSHLFI